MRAHGQLRRVLSVGLVAISLSAAPLAAATAPAGKPAAGAVDLSSIRIDNFARVNASYYRGAQPEGKDYTDLAALGVKTVINLTSDDAEANEKTMVEHAGMSYVQIPMTTHEPPTAAQIAAFLKIVDDPASQPVYVHCVGGRHRTGVMTAIYRMTDEGWTGDRAFTEMKQYKYGADFLHPEFKEFVVAAYKPQPKAKPALAPVATSVANVTLASAPATR